MTINQRKSFKKRVKNALNTVGQLGLSAGVVGIVLLYSDALPALNDIAINFGIPSGIGGVLCLYAASKIRPRIVHWRAGGTYEDWGK